MLEIIFQDDNYVAINKPNGLLVHRSTIANDVSENALQLLRDQLQMPVYPAHRLDRKTSGVLLFSINKEADCRIQALFRENKLQKSYLAILRGYVDESGEIDYPLRKENGNMQEALTRYTRLETAEIPLPLGNHPTSRYSLVRAQPETGRMHQLRKHFAHILHPIIADRPHGCNKQNKMWKEKFAMDTMMLHAEQLSFTHPFTEEQVTIAAKLQPEFTRVLSILNITTL